MRAFAPVGHREPVNESITQRIGSLDDPAAHGSEDSQWVRRVPGVHLDDAGSVERPGRSSYPGLFSNQQQ
jgi:hypothetical protein